jgi:hypothetical protein
MDATACAGHPQAAAPGGTQWCPAATLLPGIAGLIVTGVAEDADGWLAVDVITRPDLLEQARQCRGCGRRGGIKDHNVTAPRDLPIGDRKIRPRWRKTRFTRGNDGCPAETLTGGLPAVPPRARLTARLRSRTGQAPGDDLTPAATAARRYGACDPAAAAFTEHAGQQHADPDEHAEPAGTGEFRRGPPARGDKEERSQRLTHLADPGTGGTLGLARGRTGEAGKNLLKPHENRIRYVAMDLSAPCRPASPPASPSSPTRSTWSNSPTREQATRSAACPTAPGTPTRTPGCPARRTTCSGTTSRTLTPATSPSSSTPPAATPTASRSPPSGPRKSSPAPCPPSGSPQRTSPSPQRRPGQAHRLLPLVRRPRRHPRAENTRGHHRKMAAARHRRRPHRPFQRESRSTQQNRQNGRPHRTRIRQPRQPGPPRPHVHHPQRPARRPEAAATAVTERYRTAIASSRCP